MHALGLGLSPSKVLQCAISSMSPAALLTATCSLSSLLRPPPPQAFVEVMELVKSDMYLSNHARYYMREVRVLVYSQVSGGSRVMVAWLYTCRCCHACMLVSWCQPQRGHCSGKINC